MTISIVTASYNYADYIKETIESVIAQTHKAWEMVIVDDGSSDNSVDVIKKYCKKDDRIKLYQHENGKNMGLIETVKLGIEKSSGDWIIFLESDDTITPNYIEEKLKIIEQYPDVKFIFNDVNMFGDTKCIEMYTDYFENLYNILNNIIFPSNIAKYFFKMNCIPTFSVVMLKKEILKNIDWNVNIQALIDWYLWSQLAYKYDFYYIPQKLSNWRMHKDSYIRNPIDAHEWLFFKNVLIKNNVENQKFRFLNYLIFLKSLLNLYRKKIIRIHFKEKKVCIFGKWFECL